MQHGVVGVVVDGAQRGLFGRSGSSQQGQGLVGMGCQHYVVKAFGVGKAVVLAGDVHAIGKTFDALDGAVQAFVNNFGGDLVHVMPCAASDRPPLRAVQDLQQAMVVAKANHGGHRKLQHLGGGTTPDTAHHGQKVPIAESLAEAVLVQKLTQRLGQGGIVFCACEPGGNFVETQQVAQHAPETRAPQVAALGKHAGQRTTAPFHIALPGNLGGKRHVGLGGSYV